MMKNSLLVVALASAAIACAPLGKYHKDENVRQDLYGRGVEATDSSMSMFEWKEVFTDMKLQKLISKALENNIDLKVAYENVVQAQAALQGARNAYIPKLSIAPNGGWNYSRTKGVGSGNAVWNYDIAASFSWEVDIFGRLANRKDRAKAQLAGSEDYRQAVRVKLIASVANAYYSLLMLDAELRTCKEMEATWVKSVDAIHALKKEGFADEVAVSQYEATLEKLRAMDAEIRQDIIISENALSIMLAEPAQTIDRSILLVQDIPAAMKVGVPVSLLTGRPDVRAAQREVETAFYTTKDMWLNFFPTLSLTGTGSLTNIANGALVPITFLSNLGGSLVAPVLNAGVNKANLKVAESQQRIAKLNFEQTLLNAGMEVNNALTSVRQSKEKTAHYALQVASLIKAREDTELLMNNSQDKTYLDVLAAHNALVEAQMNFISAKADILKSVVSVYESLGGGSEY